MSIKRKRSIKQFVFGYFVCACTFFCVGAISFDLHAASAEIIQAQQASSPKKHVLVVFIHGTILPWVPNIYTYQPFGCDGLYDISYDPDYISAHPAAFAAALLYEKMCEFVLSSSDNSYSFCTFSWSGRLKARQRARSADNLYHALIQKIKELRAKYTDKTIEVYAFGHSHGGNVLLNLPVSEKKFGKNLIIDKAVLLGTPVQSKTEKFVYSPMFKNVYNFYSYGDLIQVLDVFSSSDIYSRRRFRSHKELYGNKTENISNIKQISVKVGGTPLRHNELWCFGGSGNYMYRDNLLIAPFPVMTFMPIILDFIDRYMQKATFINLRIDQLKTSYKISCSDRRKSSKKYKDCYCAVSFDDIMIDLIGDYLSYESRSAFRLVGLDLN